jgi:hypothetical protein
MKHGDLFATSISATCPEQGTTQTVSGVCRGYLALPGQAFAKIVKGGFICNEQHLPPNVAVLLKLR